MKTKKIIYKIEYRKGVIFPYDYNNAIELQNSLVNNGFTEACILTY